MTSRQKEQGIRLLVVDDDPVFNRILTKEAEMKGVAVTSLLSLDRPESLKGSPYDAAIVDYDLGNQTGTSVGARLVEILGEIPMILVSQKDRFETKDAQWPPCIKGFVHKDLGTSFILQAALLACEVFRKS